MSTLPKATPMESPDYLRISLAAAMTLGMKPGRFYRSAKLRCMNLLMTYDQGCAANCSYCGLQRIRDGAYDEKSFIRVEWPLLSLDELIDRCRERPNAVRRICLSMITHGRVVADARTMLERLAREVPSVPLSLLCNPTLLTREDLEIYRAIPVDRLGIAVDCANEALFDKYRGKQVGGPHRWERYWEIFREGIEVFGRDRVGVHLIVGLGETEEEIIRLIDRIRKDGGSTHLFSFFPEAGSRLANHPQPPTGQYRRVQLARHLIDEDLASADQFTFNADGQLTSFGMDPERLDQIAGHGVAFMTSGCPDETGYCVCTRPFGDCTPGDDIRSFPFAPDEDDLTQIREQLAVGELEDVPSAQ